MRSETTSNKDEILMGELGEEQIKRLKRIVFMVVTFFN